MEIGQIVNDHALGDRCAKRTIPIRTEQHIGLSTAEGQRHRAFKPGHPKQGMSCGRVADDRLGGRMHNEGMGHRPVVEQQIFVFGMLLDHASHNFIGVPANSFQVRRC